MPGSIKHVVVLALENRSFDSMLGRLRDDLDGLKGTETNPSADGVVPVWNQPGLAPATMSIPDPDPGELFGPDITTQLFGPAPSTGTPSMQGFVLNYAHQHGVTPDNAKAVMHYFTPDQVPVISQLANSFGVSDRWHASAPCQTWPNRFFMHTGTAGGYVNNSPFHFPYRMPSIFERLSAKKLSWRIYFHDMPQSATLSNIWSSGPTNFRLFEAEFVTDALSGKLPSYSFIEPRYFASTVLHAVPNDQHPPHNVHFGEQLIATIYNALRNGPNWRETLFIITYDEHGGIYDHVPPPAAVSPDDLAPDGFAFDRYGVRVPAIIISPYVPAGTVVRPPAGHPYPFDHTSILATLRKLFDLGEPLTRRDAAAPDLLHVLDLSAPANDGPQKITPPDHQATSAEVAAAKQLPPNDLQRSLCSIAAHLPASTADVTAHVAAIEQAIIQPKAPLVADVESAASYVAARMRSFVNGL